MKTTDYNKTFFDNSFSSVRMKPYYQRYPGDYKKAIRHYNWYVILSTVPALKSLDSQVDIAKQHITKRGEAITPDKINGELTMGFWVLLFNVKYERYLWKDLRKAFSNMPKAKRQRKYVSAPLNDIRALRNRVFHNESISWNLSRLEFLHNTILEVCLWINPVLPLWIKTVERFDKVILSVKRKWYGWWKYIFD